MRKKMLVAASAAALAAGVSASTALADPPGGSATDPFVCPVLTLPQQAVDSSGKFNSLNDGYYTFGPGNAGSDFNGNVPNIATNADGTGKPAANSHSSPGDTDYTAIWSGNP